MNKPEKVCRSCRYLRDAGNCLICTRRGWEFEKAQSHKLFFACRQWRPEREGELG